MSKSLAGKVALVTGGSRGIGAAIAKRLAAEGADVAFSYSASAEHALTVAHHIESLGVQALALVADQADADAVAAMVNQVHAHFGRLDILVNSAGVFVTGVIGDPQADIAELDRQQAVNVGGLSRLSVRRCRCWLTVDELFPSAPCLPVVRLSQVSLTTQRARRRSLLIAVVGLAI